MPCSRRGGRGSDGERGRREEAKGWCGLYLSPFFSFIFCTLFCFSLYFLCYLFFPFSCFRNLPSLFLFFLFFFTFLLSICDYSPSSFFLIFTSPFFIIFPFIFFYFLPFLRSFRFNLSFPFFFLPLSYLLFKTLPSSFFLPLYGLLSSPLHFPFLPYLHYYFTILSIYLTIITFPFLPYLSPSSPLPVTFPYLPPLSPPFSSPPSLSFVTSLTIPFY